MKFTFNKGSCGYDFVLLFQFEYVPNEDCEDETIITDESHSKAGISLWLGIFKKVVMITFYWKKPSVE